VPILALDTNILIYAAQTAADHRKPVAFDIVARAALADAVLPVQALAEFANACRNKGLLDPDVMVRRVVEWSEGFDMVAAAPDDVSTALRLVSRFQLAFYDAMLCATVRRAGATILISEDMHDGLDLDGLTILDPFAASNAARLADLLTLWS
jgi:predicted nucleic acid-binding protein